MYSLPCYGTVHLCLSQCLRERENLFSFVLFSVPFLSFFLFYFGVVNEAWLAICLECLLDISTYKTWFDCVCFYVRKLFLFFYNFRFFYVLISKINFLKYYFNVFSSNFFKKQPLLQFWSLIIKSAFYYIYFFCKKIKCFFIYFNTWCSIQ
jgi:glycosyltransferase involved in cell wall biosynthesis